MKAIDNCKIAFVLHTAGLGGTERSCLEAIDALAPLGCSFHVFVPEDGDLVQELIERGVHVSRLPYRPWLTRTRLLGLREMWWLGLNALCAARAGRIIRTHAVDVVYSQSIWTNMGALAAAMAGRPHIWHIREFWDIGLGARFVIPERLALSIVNRLSTTVAANSKALGKYLSKHIPEKKIRVVYNAVLLPHWVVTRSANVHVSGRPSKRLITCGIVGVVHPCKGQKDAVRAIRELLRSGINVGLLIIGRDDGQYGNRLKATVREWNLQEYVAFCGESAEPWEFMACVDIGLVCSRCEGFGRAAVEFMKLGKPVIGAGSGGTEEIIEEGVSGFLYKVGDYHDLARKIRLLAENDELRKSMGAAGRKLAAARYSVENYAEAVSSLIRESMIAWYKVRKEE